MSSFGLGIVLNFVDNASSGMNNATNTFLNMSNTIQNASRTTNVAMQQIASGTVLNTLGTSLTNFGGSMMNVVGGLMNNVKQVGSDFQLFKVTLSQLYGGATEAENQISKLLDFSVKSPFEVTDVKDMLVVLKSQGIEAFDSIKGSITGTEQETLQWINDLMAFKPDVPMDRWKKALQNYIGSGNQRSLREVLDMGKVEEIIGHDIGKTTEARLNDLIEIVEKKNLTGLTEAMFGTMQQNISNIGDYFTMLYKGIGDAGVFDNLAQITGIVSKTLAEFDNQSGKLPQIAQIIADAFNMILEPVVALTQKLADLLSSFLDFAIAHPALAKLAIVMFSVAGAATVALGWILRLSGSILMLAGSIKLLGGIKTVMSTIGTGFSVLGGKLLALLPLGILLYQAWKNKFLGIQDHVSNFSEKLGLVWDYFKQGYFTDEQYDLAKNLGILGAIEKLSILKYYWDTFKTGFAKGWDRTFEVIFKAIETGLQSIDTALRNLGVDKGLAKLLEVLELGFKTLFAVGNEQGAERLGAALGGIAASATFLLGTLKLFKGIVAIFKVVGSVFSWLGSLIMGGLTAIAGALGISVGWVIAIIVAVIAVVVLLIKYWDQVCNFFTTTVPNAFKTAVTAIGNFFKAVWTAIINNPIVQAVVRIVKAIGSVFASLFGVVMSIFNAIFQFIRAVFMGIVWVVMWVAKGIQLGFQAVWNFLQPIISAIGNAFVSVWNFIQSIWSPVAAWFGSIFSAIGNWATSVCDKIAGAFEWVAGKVKSLFDWISGMIGKVGDFFKDIGDFFGGHLPSFATGVDNFGGGLAVINEQGGELVDLPKGTRVIPHDESIKESLNEGIRLGARAMSAFNSINSNGTPVSSTTSKATSNDNRVIFGKGSIVITTVGATQAEMEKAAEFIMKYIERKQKLRSLAVRV